MRVSPSGAARVRRLLRRRRRSCSPGASCAATSPPSGDDQRNLGSSTRSRSATAAVASRSRTSCKRGRSVSPAPSALRPSPRSEALDVRGLVDPALARGRDQDGVRSGSPPTRRVGSPPSGAPSRARAGRLRAGVRRGHRRAHGAQRPARPRAARAASVTASLDEQVARRRAAGRAIADRKRWTPGGTPTSTRRTGRSVDARHASRAPSLGPAAPVPAARRPTRDARQIGARLGVGQSAAGSWSARPCIGCGRWGDRRLAA